MEEKRKFPRVNSEYNAELVIFRDAKVKAPVFVTDISLGGARLETSFSLIQGENAKLLLSPEGNQLILDSNVVWAKKEPSSDYTLYGIEFSGRGPSQGRLKDYINSRIKILDNTQHEKRQHKRMNIDVSLVHIKDNSPAGRKKAYVTDISLGGMNLYSEHSISEKERVIFEFPLTDTIAFKLSGNIVRKQKDEDMYNYGIEFIHETQELKEKLKNYIILKLK